LQSDLETQLQTGHVPDEVLEEMRHFYVLAASAVLSQTDQDSEEKP
jgi:hypothetical protein